VAGVEDDRRVALIGREDREVSVGPQCLESSPLSSRQIILGLPGCLQDPDGLLPDLPKAVDPLGGLGVNVVVELQEA
jgi:hypothetical protein